MDSLSVKFLQLHQEKIVVTNYTQWDSTTNKSTILPWKNNWLKIEISDSIDNYLNNCFLLFKDYINKNLVNNYSYWEQKWISIVLDSINLINYAQKINKSEIVSNLKEYLITDLVIKYAEKNIDQIKKIKSGSLKFSKKVFIGIE